MTPDLLAAFTTVETDEDARRIALALVGEGLAACVQIDRIDSVYRWQGEVQQAGERRLLIKTTADRWDALCRRLQALHPYELPALYALPVACAEPRYAQWVQEAGGA